MRNDRVIFDDDATAFARYLDAQASKALAGNINPADRMVLETARGAFHFAFGQLTGAIEPMRLRALMASCFVIGKAGVLSDEARQLIMAPIASGGAKGGVKTGEKRRKEREEGWEPIARKTISGIREKHPDFSQDQIADDIIAGWKFEDPKAPGHRSLTNLIGAMEKAGDLPKRRR
jgi:hypothetical protein